MKIYTKQGDGGVTSLIGGERVAKSDARVEAYGTLDELMAFVGVLMTHPECEGYREELVGVQKNLMVASAIVATGHGAAVDRVPKLEESQIEELEKRVDALLVDLPPLKYFVLPGGSSQAVAMTHVVRTVARRAERRIVALDGVETSVRKYVNRLSDYFFALGRRLAFELNDEQISWIP